MFTPLVCELSCKDGFLTKSAPITRNHVYFLGAAWQVYSGSSRREGQGDSYVSHQPLATLSILPYLLTETLLPLGLMLNFCAAFLLQQTLILQAVSDKSDDFLSDTRIDQCLQHVCLKEASPFQQRPGRDCRFHTSRRNSKSSSLVFPHPYHWGTGIWTWTKTYHNTRQPASSYIKY